MVGNSENGQVATKWLYCPFIGGNNVYKQAGIRIIRATEKVALIGRKK